MKKSKVITFIGGFFILIIGGQSAEYSFCFARYTGLYR